VISVNKSLKFGQMVGIMRIRSRSDMSTIDVRLKDDLKAFLDEEAVRSGYASTAEYVEAVLTSFWRTASESAIESELIHRIDGPPSEELPETFWDDLKSRLRGNPAAGSHK
jgi:hypothetical protein